MLGPEYLEVAHMCLGLNWSGGGGGREHIPLGSSLYTYNFSGLVFPKPGPQFTILPGPGLGEWRMISFFLNWWDLNSRVNSQASPAFTFRLRSAKNGEGLRAFIT